MAWVDLHEGILEEFVDGCEFDENDFFEHGLSILLREQVVVAHDRPDTCEHCSGVIPEKRKHKRVAKYCSKKCSLAGVREEYKASGKVVSNGTKKAINRPTHCQACSGEIPDERKSAHVARFCSKKCSDSIRVRVWKSQAVAVRSTNCEVCGGVLRETETKKRVAKFCSSTCRSRNARKSLTCQGESDKVAA
jgi:hypothetical protein